MRAANTNVTVQFSDEQLARLQRYFAQLGRVFEHRTQLFMDRYREPMAKDIQSTIPISHWHLDGRHAKTHKSWEAHGLYLGFYLKERNARSWPVVNGKAWNWREYGYLIFPAEGRGIHNPVAQDFFGKGVERHSPKIFKAVDEIMSRAIESKAA